MIFSVKKFFLVLLLLTQVAWGVDPALIVLYENDGRPAVDYSEKVATLLKDKKITWPIVLDFGHGKRFTISGFLGTGNVTAAFNILGNETEVLRIPKSTKTYKLGTKEGGPPAGLNPYQSFSDPHLGQKTIGPWQENNVLAKINQKNSDSYRYHLMEKIQVDFSLKEVINPQTDLKELYKKAAITPQGLTNGLIQLGEDLASFGAISDFHEGQVVWDHKARKFRLLDHADKAYIASARDERNVLSRSLLLVLDHYEKNKKNEFDEAVIDRLNFIIKKIKKGIDNQRRSVDSTYHKRLINSSRFINLFEEAFSQVNNIRDWDLVEQKLKSSPHAERVYVWQELASTIIKKRASLMPVNEESTWKYWIHLAENPPVTAVQEFAINELENILKHEKISLDQRYQVLDFLSRSENPELQKFALDKIVMNDTDAPMVKKILSRMIDHPNEKLSEAAKRKFSQTKIFFGNRFILGNEIIERVERFNPDRERFVIAAPDKNKVFQTLRGESEGRIMLMSLSGNKRDAALGRILLAARDREGPMPELYKDLRSRPVSVQDLGHHPLGNFNNYCLKVFGL